MGIEQPDSSAHAGAPEADSPPGDRARAALVERLFRDHNQALLRFLLARLRSRQAAQEVAQEAYVRLLNLDRPGAVSYLRAYLFKTAANLAVDRLRSGETRNPAADLPFFLTAQEERTPERAVAGEQTVQRLQRIIEALPFKWRKALVLNRFDGKDFATIAREMNLSERMVRNYVVRALLRCRAGLDRDGKGDWT